MKIAVKNLKNMNHTICTTDGKKTVISPRSFTIIDTDSDNELRYWNNVKQSNSCSKYGLEVITDEKEIMKLVVSDVASNNSENSSNKIYTDVSVVDSFVSPVARELAESTYSKEEEQIQENVTNSKYSEESLLKMEKEDLFSICDNFNIKYKRNNSVKTLVKLLMENGVVEQ